MPGTGKYFTLIIRAIFDSPTGSYYIRSNNNLSGFGISVRILVIRQPAGSGLDTLLDVNMPKTVSIVVVDDEPSICKMLTIFLARKGYGAVSFTNGYRALEYLVDKPVRLVLTDINMPEIDGIGVIRLARAIKPELSFLVMGGRLDDEEIKQGLAELGISDYLRKPFALEVLAQAIEQKLGLRVV
jgi:CheY-like chemotaxis protein